MAFLYSTNSMILTLPFLIVNGDIGSKSPKAAIYYIYVMVDYIGNGSEMEERQKVGETKYRELAASSALLHGGIRSEIYRRSPSGCTSGPLRLVRE